MTHTYNSVWPTDMQYLKRSLSPTFPVRADGTLGSFFHTMVICAAPDVLLSLQHSGQLLAHTCMRDVQCLFLASKSFPIHCHFMYIPAVV